ncbi:30S ribosomal protein S16 [Buchnera aphidicola (Aphis craccivora)]|uniref:Small ribosomal subunit protein bS16 n=1 Tax=Buchnera aphidicola (Aphis craccivora) TaxID=466616 RepID=A0A4D6XJS4_9GAMM|nr:30S ribosomal protein S16 [Buchnera aphidicola]QCI16633.1 30S ribosomal protein S16 [Buchnera aphidicola (Aphis craccivora)]QLL40766.1 30S ribosomal protein S16 [Buchnera aphidicola (Aphis craccivore)]WAI17606.1 MAG: 30S ribosomal protein S16 [Buchnera aphidicola (Aphis craccivora)]
MVKIRLARYGNKKRPFYKIVAADSRFSRDGRFIERLGYFNPSSKDITTSIKLNITRIMYWQKNGAKLSERSKKLIKLFKKNEGIL